MKNIEENPSNWRSNYSLPDFLKMRKIPAICGIDTRKLTNIIREKGSCKGCIMMSSLDPVLAIKAAKEFDHRHAIELTSNIKVLNTDLPSSLAKSLMPAQSYSSSSHIVVYDLGVKRSIIGKLIQCGAKVTVVSRNIGISEVINIKPDGFIISNGPGDPRLYKEEIENIRKIIDSGIPTLGICLGAQLIALAMGATIRKLTFGHHGINHPVLDLDNKRVYIASQNHNYVVDEKSLSKNIRISHSSLFDKTIQGFKIEGRDIFGFQGHPEGGPGPSDLSLMLSNFLKVCDRKIAA